MEKRILLTYLERAYLELVGTYGLPIVTSPKVWYAPACNEGVFERMNKLLERDGLRPLTWEEFKKLMREISESAFFYGRVYVTWAMARTNKIEPITIAIYFKISSSSF